jgi:photosynthetic reaction center cytochrome c subunit
MKNRTLKLLALIFFALAGVMVFINSSHAQKSQATADIIHHGNIAASPESRAADLLAPRTLAQQQGEKPAEQTFKNIQVLKGMPSSQLGPVMDFISSSLGVNCGFCHVPQQFDKDDKPAKVTARKMILMQFAINKDNKDIFGGTGAITCYTCHNGHTKPQVMPVLPMAFNESVPRGQARAAEENLPTVDQVLDKYLLAIGGKTAVEKLKTRVMTGTQTGADGTAIPIETYQEAPDKVVSILTAKNGVMMSGYNGTVGWVKNQRGQRQLGGAQLAAMKHGADFYGDIKLKELYPNLEVVDHEKVGDRETIMLASQPSPNIITKLYFDKQTGLLLRILTITQTVIAPIPEQLDFSDYKEVDGVKLPFTIRQSSVDDRNVWTRKYTEIKHNVPVDEAKFNMPPAPPPSPSPK